MKRVIFFASFFALTAMLTAANPPLTVAISLDIPPYIIGHASSGLEVDVIRQALPGYDITFKQMPYDGLEGAVAKGVVPVAAGVREHRPGVTYSRNFVTFINSAITKKSAQIALQNIGDLQGHRVIAWEDAWQELGPEYKTLFQFEGPGYADYLEVAKQKKQVRIFWEEPRSVIVIDRAIFNEFSKTLGHDLSTVEYHNIFPPVTAFRAGFKDPALCDQFNAGLKKMCASGSYDALLKKYDMGLDQSICPPAAK